MLAARFGAIAAAGEAAATSLLLGSWPLNEPNGAFADATGSNNATLVDPAGNTTFVRGRPAIRANGAGSLQLSDQYLEIATISAYRLSAVSAVLYLQPRTRLRGTLHWQSDRADLRGYETIWSMGTQNGALFLKRVGLGLRGGVYQSGTVQWFGGSDTDVATLNVDTAYRIVVTQGTNGAQIYVNNTLASSLPGITVGWQSVTAAIRIGRLDGTIRPPYTGLGSLVSDARVYSGQLSSGDMTALPAAASALPYTKPASLAALPVFIVENQAGGTTTAKLQAAVNAANSAGGGWVQQTDPSTPLTGIGDIRPRANAHYYRLNLRSTENSYYWQRQLTFHESSTGEGNFDSHGGNPHYVIGCIFDHRHQQQVMIDNGTPGGRTLGTGNSDYNTIWPGANSPDSSEARRWHFEQARLSGIRGTTSTRPYVVYQFCEFINCNSDAISVNENSRALVEDCYAYQVRRGFLVQNGGNSEIIAKRCETEGNYPVDVTSAPLIETGMCDVEPFNNGAGTTGKQTDFKLYDCWMTSDWDVQPEGPNTDGAGGEIDMRNTHMTKSSFVMWTPVGSHGKAVKSWTTKGSTVRYSVDQGGASTGSTLRGARVGDEVILFEDMLFIACGNFLHFHGVYRNWTTSNTFGLQLDDGWSTGAGPKPTLRIFRRCRWETENLPNGISSSNVFCIRQNGATSPVCHTEFDNCTISNGFAQDRPFLWAGQRVFLTNGGVVRDNGRANADLFQGSWS